MYGNKLVSFSEMHWPEMVGFTSGLGLIWRVVGSYTNWAERSEAHF